MKKVALKSLKQYEQIKDIKILEGAKKVLGYQIQTDRGTYQVKGNSKKTVKYSSDKYGINGALFEFKTLDNLPVAFAAMNRTPELLALI